MKFIFKPLVLQNWQNLWFLSILFKENLVVCILVVRQFVNAILRCLDTIVDVVLTNVYKELKFYFCLYYVVLIHFFKKIYQSLIKQYHEITCIDILPVIPKLWEIHNGQKDFLTSRNQFALLFSTSARDIIYNSINKNVSLSHNLIITYDLIYNFIAIYIKRVHVSSKFSVHSNITWRWSYS